MLFHRMVLFAGTATLALAVPLERAALMLVPGGAGSLYAQALAAKGGGGGDHDKGGRDHDKGDRGGRSGDRHDHEGKGKAGSRAKDDADARNHDDDQQGKRMSGLGEDGRKSRKTVKEKFDPDNFVRKIDNPYMPLEPGTVYVVKGEDLIGRFKVTDRKREIAGVRTIVVKDVEFVEGKLEEKTFDYFAQDKAGNVWYFGEDTAQYENGKKVGAEGSWLAGVDGAKPGIVMLADPKVGLTYSQENAPGVAEDKARVVSLHAKASVPYGRFEDVLKTSEFSPIEPDLQEFKFYAPGIGQLLTIDKLTGEREELVRIRQTPAP